MRAPLLVCKRANVAGIEHRPKAEGGCATLSLGYPPPSVIGVIRLLASSSSRSPSDAGSSDAAVACGRAKGIGFPPPEEAGTESGGNGERGFEGLPPARGGEEGDARGGGGDERQDASRVDGVSSLGSNGGKVGASEDVREGGAGGDVGVAARSWDTDTNTRSLQRQLVALNQGMVRCVAKLCCRVGGLSCARARAHKGQLLLSGACLAALRGK